MQADQYINIERQTDSHAVLRISEQQASRFARHEAGDFNPIHDPGSKRFCVPGDLLFTALVHHYGLTPKTRVEFLGMLDGDTALSLPAADTDDSTRTLLLCDQTERKILSIEQSGRARQNLSMIAALTAQYVQFSGKTFPDILVPVMREAGRMINPQRPLVIYQDMCIEFDEALSSEDLTPVKLQFSGVDSNFEQKKGLVTLNFDLTVDEQPIGAGYKNMILGGLRDFDEAAMQGIIDEYEQRRQG